MKTVPITFALLVVLITFPAAAQGGEGSGVLPEARVALPPEIAECVAACTASGAAPNPAAHAVCADVADATARSRIEELAREIATIRRRVTTVTTSIADHRRRITELEGRTGLLSSRDAELEAEIRRQNEAIGRLEEDIRSLRRQYELVIRDYVDLAVRIGVLEEQFREQEAAVARLDARVSSLESRITSVRVAVLAGPLVLHAFDDTNYTGGLLDVQLTLQLSNEVRAFVEGGTALSIGPSPVGAHVRGGAGYDFTPNWGIEAGLSSTWLGYNTRLEARSMFLMGDVGASFSWKPLTVSANVLLGGEFDQGPPAFAVGGLVRVGLRFPW